MTSPIVIPARGGEVVGDAPDRRVEILSDVDGLHATWSRFAAGREGADLHVHRRHTDLFYVLSGELTLRLGIEDEPVVVPAGTLARMPPMVPHGFGNCSGDDVTYLNLHAPGRGFAAFLRTGDIGGYDQEPPPADGVRPASEARIGGEADEEAIRVREVRAATAETRDGHTASYWAVEGDLTLTLTVDGREHVVQAGSWAQVPPGVAHAAAGERFLAIHTPG